MTTSPDNLRALGGVGEEQERALKRAGYETQRDLHYATQADIASVDGISKPLAARIKYQVGEPDDETEMSEADMDTMVCSSWTVSEESLELFAVGNERHPVTYQGDVVGHVDDVSIEKRVDHEANCIVFDVEMECTIHDPTPADLDVVVGGPEASIPETRGIAVPAPDDVVFDIGESSCAITDALGSLYPSTADGSDRLGRSVAGKTIGNVKVREDGTVSPEDLEG